MDFNFKIKLHGKRLFETNSIKYLGIRINSKLKWKTHIDNIALKAPCPSAPVRCASLASPVNKFAEIASLVSNYPSPAIK